jgi:hypothetical protein
MCSLVVDTFVDDVFALSKASGVVIPSKQPTHNIFDVSNASCMAAVIQFIGSRRISAVGITFSPMRFNRGNALSVAFRPFSSADF